MAYSNLEEHISNLEKKLQDISRKIKTAQESATSEKEKFLRSKEYMVPLARQQAQTTSVPSMNLELPENVNSGKIDNQIIWSCLFEMYKL